MIVYGPCECSHLALWFNWFHRELRAIETAIGHGLSVTRCLGWTQHHRRKLDTSAGTSLQLYTTSSAIILLQFILFEIKVPSPASSFMVLT